VRRGISLFALTLAAQAILPAAVLLSEGFDDISLLPGQGWGMVNNSTFAVTGWFQGNPGVFPAHSGPAESYIAANFLNGLDISNWLITPELTLQNGVVITFYTRSGGFLPDRLQLRMSTAGGSMNAGGDPVSTGDFSMVLAEVNPMLSPGGYPTDWTLVLHQISGLAGPVQGRLAFRYFVPNALANGDYIGIDSLTVTGPMVNPIPEPGTFSALVLAAAAAGFRRLRRN